MKMNAFLSAAREGEAPPVLAARLDAIIDDMSALSQLSAEQDRCERQAALRRRLILERASRSLAQTRDALGHLDAAPPSATHALDPLLVAVIRGDLAFG
jgi:hypothetical protein